MNNTISEGTVSAQNILRRVEPTRHLFEGAKYIPADKTDVRRTFEKFARLARFQARAAV